MAAVAESPPVRYSMEDAVHSSTQPRPVVVINASTPRSKAPVRRSSATTASATWSTDRPFDSPAYTRIGSMAGFPVAAAIAAGVDPSATNACPLRPSDRQDSADAGLPDRSGEVGAVRPSGVTPLTTAALSAA